MSSLGKSHIAVAFHGASGAPSESTWPRASSKPTPSPAASRARTPGLTAPRRVLIVEDEAVIAMNLESFVEDFGLEVCGKAASGAHAVELAKSQRPDVILMDVNLMGEMDGVEAARLAREAVGPAIVFVTAYGSGEVMDRIRSTFPDAPVVPKPVNASTLRRAIERAEIH
jgi:CheY-like chemotaxis protein